MRLGWLSDVHLNLTDDAGRRRFFGEVRECDADLWLVSGDTGEAPSVVAYLQEFEREVDSRACFVLGNHDFYKGSIREVVADVSAFAQSNHKLTWLTQARPQVVQPDVAIVGDDGWADGRLGDPLGTPVELNDFHLIEELIGHPRDVLVRRLNRLGDKAAERLRVKLDDAASRCKYVVVVTHPPPFAGAAWHEGEPSSPEWLPWFSCDAVGRVIMECAARHPSTCVVVLCGHTHSVGQFSPRSNVTVHTAGAEYGLPRVQAVFELGDGPASSWAGRLA